MISRAARDAADELIGLLERGNGMGDQVWMYGRLIDTLGGNGTIAYTSASNPDGVLLYTLALIVREAGNGA